MRLTTMTDYAMRLLMYVGRHPDRLCTIAEIAQAYRISEPHLMKITHRLAQRGWLETIRGKNGGMRLAHLPEEINLGAVVRDTENDLALVECFVADNACTLSGQCNLTTIIDGALQQFMQHLDRYTLADIIPRPTEGTTAPVTFAKLDKTSNRR
ncbi:RrF2 family transcriptional regulator [Pollutimonas harenae]|uniref:Rrf2 family transcriptional regulator n=1 Tax=Pollutimonas harenae TaxID=657015 RepID=A0A853GUL3_9BURK|nr:Rrf2 family transcriptional regulator [Pollutimonas harenae]NYT86868.1 Rrf2 family transcriptional regulator [Pollutimonas harenae]TEA69415.1 Rrf2 family transcriptional regulator [Pollutimonas harenae]